MKNKFKSKKKISSSEFNKRGFFVDKISSTSDHIYIWTFFDTLKYFSLFPHPGYASRLQLKLLKLTRRTNQAFKNLRKLGGDVEFCILMFEFGPPSRVNFFPYFLNCDYSCNINIYIYIMQYQGHKTIVLYLVNKN